jgi:hypothetical protein
MTLPGSGPLSLNDIHVEINGGGASGTIIDMAYVYNNTKSGQQSYSMSNYYSKAFYQKNNDNCNNGNCNFGGNCNCYDFPYSQCTGNCYGSQCIGGNCDAVPGYLQNNCNCDNGATYNCVQHGWADNCNCSNCNCNCGK